LNPIVNQYDVFLDLVFDNFLGMLHVAPAGDSILRLNRHYPAFVLTYDVQYLRYIFMSRCISRFDFKRADIDAMISHHTVVNWPDVFLVNDIETCVGQLYDVIDKCFDLYVPEFFIGGPDVKYPWLDRDLRNLDKNKIKAHKFIKKVSKSFERTGDEEDKTEFNAACARFLDLRGDFKSVHRMKNDLYIEGM
jgi:hypothetical protein